MARKNPVPEREVEICKRLKSFRETTKLTRVMFARELEIDSSQLSNLEHCRAPLRYEVAYRLFKKFSVHPKWMATGEGNAWPGMAIPNFHVLGIEPRTRFSEAYDAFLIKKCNDINEIPLSEIDLSMGKVYFRSDAKHRVAAVAYLVRVFLYEWFAHVPDKDFNHLLNGIILYSNDMVSNKYPRDTDEEIESRKKQMLLVMRELKKRKLGLGSLDIEKIFS